MTTSVTVGEHLAVALPGPLVGRHEVALDEPQHDGQRRRHGEGDEGQDPVIGQHDGGDHQHQRTVEQPGQATPLEELGEGLDVARHAGDQRPPPLLVVVGQADAVDVRDQAGPEVVERLLGPLAQADDGLALGDAGDDERNGGDTGQRDDQPDAHALRGHDAAIDGLLQQDRHDDPAGGADGRQQPGQTETLAQHRRLLQSPVDGVHAGEPADRLGHQAAPPATPAGSSARSLSNASTRAR